MSKQLKFVVNKDQLDEIELLRRIAEYAYQYSREKMHEDSLNLQKLAKEWAKTFRNK